MPKAEWTFMGFITDSQLLSLRLRRGGVLWLSPCIPNGILPAWGGLDFYGFEYRFSIIVIPPKAGWIFMTFT